MKHILVLGATGRIGRLMLPMLSQNGNQVTAYVRNAEKATGEAFKNVTVVEGDVLCTERLHDCMKGQEIVAAILSGELLSYAESIAAALQRSGVQRTLWVTGMGIHHEVPGEVGKMLDELCRQMPEYVQAADTIASSGTPYTLIRAAHLTDGGCRDYVVQHEGEPLHANTVDRVAVAAFLSDLIANDIGVNESLGITN